MIPSFPNFKPLEIVDKKDIHLYTDPFPCYSDYDFASMWSWNIVEGMGISLLYDNLVVKFSDYLTGESFLSFIGTHNVNETVEQILNLSVGLGIEPKIKLLPEESVQGLDLEKFVVHEDRDNFDYLYLISELILLKGSFLKDHRYLVNYFIKNYPDHEVLELDVSQRHIQDKILDLYHKWEENKGYIVDHEYKAVKRAFESVSEFDFITIGVSKDDRLIAFNLYQKTTSDTVNCLFAKADINFNGIYSLLMCESSKILQKHGFRFINFEQDLGLYNLRKAKSSFGNTFLKKYYVRLRDNN